MSESTTDLRRKIVAATDLQSVVRTMKALAAANIGQYERSVASLADYTRAVETGLGAALRALPAGPPVDQGSGPANALVIVLGSDQGLVGQFNDVVADCASALLSKLGGRTTVLVLGERAAARLLDLGTPVAVTLPVPGSIAAVTPLVDRLVIEIELARRRGGGPALHIVFNRHGAAATFAPTIQKLLPLDDRWRRDMAAKPWRSGALPEPLGSLRGALRELIREYLFVALFRACAESLAGENASRLAAMERADRNISDLLSDLRGQFHRLRQSGIDEELFDVVAGFEALSEAPAA